MVDTERRHHSACLSIISAYDDPWHAFCDEGREEEPRQRAVSWVSFRLQTTNDKELSFPSFGEKSRERGGRRRKREELCYCSECACPRCTLNEKVKRGSDSALQPSTSASQRRRKPETQRCHDGRHRNRRTDRGTNERQGLPHPQRVDDSRLTIQRGSLRGARGRGMGCKSGGTRGSGDCARVVGLVCRRSSKPVPPSSAAVKVIPCHPTQAEASALSQSSSVVIHVETMTASEPVFPFETRREPWCCARQPRCPSLLKHRHGGCQATHEQLAAADPLPSVFPLSLVSTSPLLRTFL